MKVFIQQNRTKEFYGDGGQWVPTRTGALDCRTSEDAEQVVKRDSLTDVSIYLMFTNIREPLVLPPSKQRTAEGAPDHQSQTQMAE
jgi:hypothetical protein